MNILTEKQANMMFRNTDKLLLVTDFSENILDENIKGIVEHFHCNEIYQLKLDDKYWKNIRADTFCIEVGWSEYHYTETQDNPVYPTLYIVTANHKGIRMYSIWEICN